MKGPVLCCRSARRNLTRSFEEVAKQTSSNSTSTLSESENEDKTWKGTVEEEAPAINEMEPAPQVTKGNLSPSKQPLYGDMVDHPVLMAHPGNVRPEAQQPPPRAGPGEEGRIGLGWDDL